MSRWILLQYSLEEYVFPETSRKLHDGRLNIPVIYTATSDHACNMHEFIVCLRGTLLYTRARAALSQTVLNGG